MHNKHSFSQFCPFCEYSYRSGALSERTHVSELAEDLLTGDGAKRAKIGVNAFMHGGAGSFGPIEIYCAKLFIPSRSPE